MKTIFYTWLVFLFFFITINSNGCIIMSSNGKTNIADTPKTDSLNIPEIIKEMPPLDLTEKPVYPDSIHAYFKFYGLVFDGVLHYFGKFKSDDKTIAGHVFIPDNPRGTVIILHGYFDHSGIFNKLIKFCLEMKYAVCIYDLPGHGLSSGKRASIDDFDEYLQVFEDFMSIIKPVMPKPFHLMAHSTGCSIGLDYMHFKEDHGLSKVIFLAPLVQNAYFELSKFGYYVTNPFLDNVPRNFRENSSDEAFTRFIEDDPLQAHDVPYEWLDALYRWNKQVKKYPPIDHPVLVIQGTDDMVVDWDYNLPFLKKKIKPIDIKMVENAKHQLMNEEQRIREEVFGLIKQYIRD